MATLTAVNRRKKIKDVVVPPAGTPEREEWNKRQTKLQEQHTASFIKRREQEIKDYKALAERRRYQRRRDQSGGTLFGDEDLPPVPARPIVPPRGPKTDGGNKVISDGEVPVIRDKRKARTKVEAARDRAKRGES